MKGSARKTNRSKRNKSSGQQIRGLTNVRGLFPAMFRGKMFYENQLVVQPVAAAMAYNSYRANSVFDPDLSGVGTTVAGYNQAAAVYGRYRVLAVKAIVSFINRGADGTHVFIAATPQNTIGTNFVEAMAQRNVWQQPLAAVGGSGIIKHVVSFPIHKIYGVPAQQVRNEDDFAGLISANPNNTLYLHIGAFNPGSSTGAVNFAVRFEFDVVWSLPLDMEY